MRRTCISFRCCSRNLPARDLVDSDFTYLNERLAAHYGIPGVSGVAMRRVTLPADSVRGGLVTQASVLKVTANGTTTSPVVRGHFITERFLGLQTPPPLPGVGKIDPDIRGATTIRQQLEKHRADPSCAVCHSKMDPAGFALGGFDILGGWRDRYRAESPDHLPVPGFGKNGWPLTYYFALPADASGALPDGRAFKDIRDFKRIAAHGATYDRAQPRPAATPICDRRAGAIQRSRADRSNPAEGKSERLWRPEHRAGHRPK